MRLLHTSRRNTSAVCLTQFLSSSETDSHLQDRCTQCNTHWVSSVVVGEGFDRSANGTIHGWITASATGEACEIRRNFQQNTQWALICTCNLCRLPDSRTLLKQSGELRTDTSIRCSLTSLAGDAARIASSHLVSSSNSHSMPLHAPSALGRHEAPVPPRSTQRTRHHPPFCPVSSRTQLH